MINDSGLLDLNIIKKTDVDTKSIKEDHKELSKEVESKKNIRDKLYGRINVSVKTMDIVITVLMIALFVSVILGIMV